ncbi:MAG: hypothetical protein M1113_01770 [Candidatus Thermoplasmatota archaeon]|nr:hypothetical protein [Candidatus Thermoplasmatota archaeon]
MPRYSEADLLALEGQLVIIERKNGKATKGILKRSNGPLDWVVVTRFEKNVFGGTDEIVEPVFLADVRIIMYAEQNKDNRTSVIRKGKKRGFEVGLPFIKYKSENSEETEEK